MLKKILTVCLVVFLAAGISTEAFAAKKAKKMNAEQISEAREQTDYLMKKIYAHGLFSPKDNESLINLKMQLDNSMLISIDPQLAPIYFKLGIINKARELKDDSIDCFQTILENFPDTAFSPKAKRELQKMGVSIKDPSVESQQ